MEGFILKTKLLAILLILSSVSTGFALTIHRNELCNLEIAYDYYHSRNYVNIDQIEPNQWKLVPKKTFEDIDPYNQSDKVEIWFGFDSKSDFNREIDNLLFTHAYQISSSRLNQNVIFIWQKLPGDSLKLVGSTAYESKCSTYGFIFHVGQFPDSSLFIIAHTKSVGSGLMCDDLIVLKEVMKNKYELIYSNNLFRYVFESKYVDLTPLFDTTSKSEYMITLNYKYYELFLKEDSTKVTTDGKYVTNISDETDSTRTETIDLWKLAKKKYNLED